MAGEPTLAAQRVAVGSNTIDGPVQRAGPGHQDRCPLSARVGLVIRSRLRDTRPTSPGDGEGADRGAQRKAGGVYVHLRYLEREGVTREGEPGRLYSTFTDDVDRDAFTERGLDDRHQFHVIRSPEDGAAHEDLKPSPDVMAQMEADLGTTLYSVAVDHHGQLNQPRHPPSGERSVDP
jgi:hypothetical protein